MAVGGASTFARIGSMSAPYIVDILGRTRMDLDVKRSKLLFSCPGKVSAGIPAMIFGASSVAAGLAAMV